MLKEKDKVIMKELKIKDVSKVLLDEFGWHMLVCGGNGKWLHVEPRPSGGWKSTKEAWIDVEKPSEEALARLKCAKVKEFDVGGRTFFHVYEHGIDVVTSCLEFSPVSEKEVGEMLNEFSMKEV